MSDETRETRTWMVLLRGGLVPTVVVSSGLAAGAVPAGGRAVAGVLVGAVLAAGGLAVGPLTMRLARRLPDAALLGVAVLAYAAAVLTLGGLYLLLAGAGWLDGSYVAVGAIGACVAWIGGQVRATARLRVPIFGGGGPSRG